MLRRRGTAVASALDCAALAAAGCGLGPGADVGDVQLTVTREFGAEPMLDRSLAAKESDTVMRLLEGEADVETRYGGGYVHAIDGVAEEQRGGDPYDWFFYVDGEESQIGAAEVERSDSQLMLLPQLPTYQPLTEAASEAGLDRRIAVALRHAAEDVVAGECGAAGETGVHGLARRRESEKDGAQRKRLAIRHDRLLDGFGSPPRALRVSCCVVRLPSLMRVCALLS